MAKAIMIQGTMSNAGKSVLVAALCRIFNDEGYRVAPFKSQNMALNSFVTTEGLEMGRAQVMQAEAARTEPCVSMNPILLKPTSDTGSQVIVNGEVLGTMSAREYFRHKLALIPDILAAYRSLAQRYDILVLEGAGSPAEINLKADDIVNMGLARLVGAPVVLVGDIDRGGVFASLYGTVALLDPEERAMLKGLVINKFRGDRSILQPGLHTLETLTKQPVLGVVPWMELDLDEEDSLSSRFSTRREGRPLDVAVIQLPRISNFTDFAPLERHPAFGVRYVTAPAALGNPDLIILPGTKNTLSDLLWLRSSGLEGTVLRLVERGAALIGICGGFQMLGCRLDDPHGVELGGSLRGMELLPVSTVFSCEKTRTQRHYKVEAPQGFFSPLHGISVTGYEIHMGHTTPHAHFVSAGKVLGTYLHGLFDTPALVDGLATLLLGEKGTLWSPGITDSDLSAYKDRQYDALAAAVRENLDLTRIHQILQEGLT